MAGFWNSHVHFFGPPWDGAPGMSAEKLEGHLQDMLTRHGFVHVFDAASFPDITLGIRQRIQSGEVKGPDILTAGTPLVPIHGTPRYVEPVTLPEPASAQEARELVRQSLARGMDGVKLFTVSLTSHKPYPNMNQEIVDAAVEEAHAQGKPVIAHPTNLEGVVEAVSAGVDILAHTAPIAGPLPESLHLQMVRQHTVLIPTLMLWEYELRREGKPDEDFIRAFMQTAQRQMVRHAELGGRVLFGTDVGYMTDDDPRREYTLMKEAGLSFPRILATLTTEPAEQFHQGTHTGRLEPGFDADVVVVHGDPSVEIEALARVGLVLKQGQIQYQAPSSPRFNQDGSKSGR
jgi:imidazolonepropionase-like amidohydrolase